MPTALDLIKRSMRRIGALATGETPTATEAADALRELNSLLENWSTERLTVYRSVQIVHTLSAGQASYTIGPAAQINAQRPIRVTGAFVRDAGQDWPVVWVDDGLFDSVESKSVQGLPEWLRYNADFPQATITLWPVPAGAYELHLTTDMQFTQLTQVSDQISLPPGYDRALMLALAIDLAGEFGRPVTAELVQLANDAKADIKRANKQPVVAGLDPALTLQRPSDEARFLSGV